jgi:hypothetical protein
MVTLALTVWGYLTVPPASTFSGLVYNWQDNNTYLAKIRQGFRGDWVFTNPYSIEPGPPIYALYINYLLLGHIARWHGLETILIFHLARLVNGAILLFTIYVFVARSFNAVLDRRFAFLVCTVGSGFGWLALLFGHVAPDIWQTELSPFLSILSNPHYPLAIAAFIWLIDLVCVEQAPEPGSSIFQWALLVVGTLILAITQPYALVIVAFVAALWIGTDWLNRRHIEPLSLERLFVMVILAAPFALYDVWIVTTSADIAALYAQDIALTHPVFELLVGGGALLILGAIGVVFAVRRFLRDGPGHRSELTAILWLLVASLLMYAPSLQQRRFAFALFVPLGILSVQALKQFKRFDSPALRLAFVGLTSLTNIMFLLVILVAVNERSSYLFFAGSEWKGMMYLRSSVDQHSVVLASPEMGLYIPAWAGQRVVFGHTVETLHGLARFQEVRSFFTGQLNEPEMFLASVDVIFMGSRERSLGSPQIPPAYVQVFSDGDKVIYKRK